MNSLYSFFTKKEKNMKTTIFYFFLNNNNLKIHKRNKNILQFKQDLEITCSYRSSTQLQKLNTK